MLCILAGSGRSGFWMANRSGETIEYHLPPENIEITYNLIFENKSEVTHLSILRSKDYPSTIKDDTSVSEIDINYTSDVRVWYRNVANMFLKESSNRIRKKPSKRCASIPPLKKQSISKLAKRQSKHNHIKNYRKRK